MTLFVNILIVLICIYELYFYIAANQFRSGFVYTPRLRHKKRMEFDHLWSSASDHCVLREIAGGWPLVSFFGALAKAPHHPYFCGEKPRYLLDSG